MSNQNSIKFQSVFLNEQLQIGNLEQFEGLPAVQIKPSFEFNDVEYDNRHRHRDKITALLRKESYTYIDKLGCYIDSTR